MSLVAGPFPPEAVFVLVPLAGLLWGVIFCVLALPFRLFQRTRRPWMAVGIPTVAALGLGIYGAWNDMRSWDTTPPLYFLLERLITVLLAYAIGTSLAIWFYKRRDARGERNRDR